MGFNRPTYIEYEQLCLLRDIGFPQENPRECAGRYVAETSCEQLIYQPTLQELIDYILYTTEEKRGVPSTVAFWFSNKRRTQYEAIVTDTTWRESARGRTMEEACVLLAIALCPIEEIRLPSNVVEFHRG